MDEIIKANEFHGGLLTIQLNRSAILYIIASEKQVLVASSRLI